MKKEIRPEKDEARKKRYSADERLSQVLQVLLFQGPMNLKDIANTIAKYTKRENEDLEEKTESTRVILHRHIPRLLGLKLIAKSKESKKFDITPFGIYVLFGERSRYYHIATMYALEKRYPYLYKHFSTLLFLCKFNKRYKIDLFENKTHRYSDGYIDLEITLHGGDLPELKVTPRLDLILRDIHKFNVKPPNSLEDLLLRVNCPLDVEDFCKEEAKDEYHCLTTGKCTCVIGTMCDLLEEFDKQVLEQYYGLKMDTPEAYYLFKLFEDLYHGYVEDCDRYIIKTFADRFLSELGVFTQKAVSREIEFYIHASSEIADILRIYIERIAKNPFLMALEPFETEDIERSLKEALDYLNDVKSRISQKTSKD